MRIASKISVSGACLALSRAASSPFFSLYFCERETKNALAPAFVAAAAVDAESVENDVALFLRFLSRLSLVRPPSGASLRAWTVRGGDEWAGGGEAF